MSDYKFSKVTPEVQMLADKSVDSYKIDPELYSKFDVKRGLRDVNGNGVVAGLTNISTIKVLENGSVQNRGDGKLYYRGIDVEDIVAGFVKEKRFGFEETVYLLLFGNMPSEKELDDFKKLLADFRTLPPSFTRDVIMKSPSDNMMNTLAKSVLALYSYDDDANNISIPNVLRQSIALITLFPMLSVYGYQAYNYSKNGESLFIHKPQPELSIAENILYMLRSDCKYSELEARILDLALVLHAEHGGGNNSTFTVHVVSSSGTDTYSAIAAALGSLKGPKHGGANIKVAMMFDDMKKQVKDWKDEDEVRGYLQKLLRKEAFDLSGLDIMTMSVNGIWDMQFIQLLILELRCLNHSLRSFLLKREERMNLLSILSLRNSLLRLLQARDVFIRASALMWISTADSFTECLVSRMSCLRLFSLLHVLPAGLLIVSRSL